MGLPKKKSKNQSIIYYLLKIFKTVRLFSLYEYRRVLSVLVNVNSLQTFSRSPMLRSSRSAIMHTSQISVAFSSHTDLNHAMVLLMELKNCSVLFVKWTFGWINPKPARPSNLDNTFPGSFSFNIRISSSFNRALLVNKDFAANNTN